MSLKKFITVDAETERINSRPNYPPKPVGVAINKKYYAFNHPTENNCTEREAKAALEKIWKSDVHIAGSHFKFDYDVFTTHWKFKNIAWDRIEDTEYLLFLHDPHARELALKPSAARILKIKPDERDELKDWITEHIAEARKKPSEWGAYISRAPGKLVGKYAVGDTYRSGKLTEHLHPLICKRGMEKAYDRERRLMPIFLENEREGIRVDLKRMEDDYAMYSSLIDRETDSGTVIPGLVDNWLRKKLHAPNLNLDADKDLGDVLDREGIVTDWTWTAGGKNKAPQRSVSKKNLTIAQFRNQKVAVVYAYRVRLATSLRMFFESWLTIARENEGTIFTNWNQTRQVKNAKESKGTRTGRPSSDRPNFLNIPKNFEDKDDGYKHPAFFNGLPELPLMRRYMLPDKDAAWLHRDYNQQELRMLAHFEDDVLAASYSKKPYRDKAGKMLFDVHTTVQEGVLEIAALALTRGGTKILNFSDVYGKGLANLAEDLGLDLESTKAIRAAKNALMPGVQALNDDLKWRGKQGLSIRTWGGREYFVEPPMYVKKFNRVMSFEYKLLNYLIQGSSADVTKEALIRYDEHPKRESRFLVTVYDEINISSPSLKGLSAKAKKDCVTREMRILRECMESIETDVPMLSEGKVGPNWGTLSKFFLKEELGV